MRGGKRYNDKPMTHKVVIMKQKVKAPPSPRIAKLTPRAPLPRQKRNSVKLVNTEHQKTQKHKKRRVCEEDTRVRRDREMEEKRVL